jgi:multiple sugar transport system ATP-binding protein
VEAASREGGPLIAKVSGDSGLVRDENVSLALAPNVCHVFDDRDFALRRLA